MDLKTTFSLRVLGLAAILAATVSAGATVTETQKGISFYDAASHGYVSTMLNTRAGIVVATERGKDISVIRNGKMVPMVSGPGVGMYIHASKDGQYIGYKSINNNTDQAPMVLDVTTGRSIILESYTNQCGQPSFADDNTVCYTVGNKLVVRKIDGSQRREYNMPFYVNIVNISPDGTRAAFGSIDGDFYMMNLADGDIVTVPGGEGAYNPVWSPDGTRLAVQRVNGNLFTIDAATKVRHNIGEVSSFNWTEDSKSIVYTQVNRINDMLSSGASVCRVAWDGSSNTKIIDNDASCPVAVLADGNALIVSYAVGTQRGLSKRVYRTVSDFVGAPARTVSLVSFGKDEQVGNSRITNFKGFSRTDAPMASFEDIMADNAKARNLSPEQRAQYSSGTRKGNDIGLTAIPYINQVWDTPGSYSGNYSVGYVCCAPSSCCMNLGWRGKLSKVAVTSRASGVGTVYYSWQVLRDYTSSTGYAFTQRASYYGSVGGGYGYMWGLGSPATMMASFYQKNGLNSSFASSWSTFCTQTNNNDPYTICLANGTGGHVVLGFRTNQAAASNGSSTWAKTGSFICHDPYGDYNGASYPNWDGRYSTYDWPGYSNGYKNIGTFHWGCIATGSKPTPSNPTLTVSPASVNFTCELNQHPSATIKVTGKDLSSDITIASYTPGRFTPSVTSLPKTGGTFKITFNISDKIGTYGEGGSAVNSKFYVKVKSGSLEKIINITATVTAPPLGKLSEKWNLSEKKGNKDSKGYDASNIRNFVYNDGKLYCVYNHSDILVLNAQTGAKLGFLPKNDIVKGGTLTLCDVKCINGKILACNIAKQGEEFRVYAWDNDNSYPTLALSTSDIQGAARVGDCMELTGTYPSDYWLAFCNDNGTDTRIVEYHMNGTKIAQAKNTKVLKDGKQWKTGATSRAYPKGSGWWVDGSQSMPAWTNNPNNGTCTVQCINTCADGKKPWGASHHEFNWKGGKYAINLIFEGTTNYTGAKMRIVKDNAGDYSNTTENGKYPADGLGDATKNTNSTGDCMINTDGNSYLEAWVLSTKHGMAYYAYGNPPVKNPSAIVGPGEPNPTISANPTSLSFTSKKNAAVDKDLKIEGANLKGNITATLSGTNANMFKLSNTSLSNSGTIKVTYTPTAEGTHKATITLSSQGATNVTVALNGTCEATITLLEDIAAHQDKLSEEWIYSTNKNNSPSWTSFVTTESANRDIALIGDKLYVLNGKNWGDVAVNIINAKDGKHKGSLSVADLGSALGKLGGLAVADGKLIASNIVTAAQNLRVYIWDNDAAAPRVLVQKDGAGIITGASVAFSGTLNNGRVWLTKDGSNEVVYFEIKNGSCDNNMHTIALKNAKGEAYAYGSDGRGASKIYPNTDGSFWMAQKDNQIAKFDASGKITDEILPKEALGGSSYGTAFAQFSIGNKRYIAAITYKTGNLQDGQVAIIDVTSGVAKATAPIKRLPENGFGSNVNSQYMSTVVVSAEGSRKGIVNIYANVFGQGLGYFKYAGEMADAISDITVDGDNADVEYFNLQGIRVDADNLTPGIYVRRQGNKATKVVIK